jgi:predicted transcriptional regulator
MMTQKRLRWEPTDGRIQVSFLLQKKDHRRLKHLATDTDRTLSEVIEQACLELLSRQK